MRSTLRLGASLALALACAGMAWAGPVSSYRAHGIVGEAGPPPYGLRLDGFYDDNAESVNTFSFDDVVFEEYQDGSARLYGQVELNTIGTGLCCNYWLDVRFVRITSSRELAKIQHYRNDWRYYRICSRGPELVSQDDASDRTDFWTYPFDGSMPFQVGYGANGKNDNFGAAGWVSYLHAYEGKLYGSPCKYIPASDFLMDLDIPTDVAASSPVKPGAFAVRGNFPNPFNPSTTIEYDLATPSRVKIEIFNVMGTRVCELLNEHQVSGHHLVRWDGTTDRGVPVASGTYIYRVATDDAVETKKMVLLR